MMKIRFADRLSRNRRCHSSGFSLIEMLVVIAIIGALAALVVGGASHAKKTSTIGRVKAELNQISTAIEAYHKKFGFYPPDNPNNPASPPLYYELTGEPLGGASATAFFGVKGIVNAQAESNGRVPSFFANLGVEGKGFKDIDPNPAVSVFALAVPARGPDANPELNLWRYVSKNPTNNPERFDLWAEVVIGNDKLTIGNWKD